MSDPLLTDEEREYMVSVAKIAAAALTVTTWVLAFLTVTAVVFWIVIIAAVFGS